MIVGKILGADGGHKLWISMKGAVKYELYTQNISYYSQVTSKRTEILKNKNFYLFKFYQNKKIHFVMFYIQSGVQIISH